MLGDPGGHQVDFEPVVYLMASKTKSFLGCIRRNSDSRLREMSLLSTGEMYECCAQCWALYCKRAMDIMECIQQEDSQMIMGLEPLK